MQRPGHPHGAAPPGHPLPAFIILAVMLLTSEPGFLLILKRHVAYRLAATLPRALAPSHRAIQAHALLTTREEALSSPLSTQVPLRTARQPNAWSMSSPTGWIDGEMDKFFINKYLLSTYLLCIQALSWALGTSGKQDRISSLLVLTF